jgi:hypothetical protein
LRHQRRLEGIHQQVRNLLRPWNPPPNSSTPPTSPVSDITDNSPDVNVGNPEQNSQQQRRSYAEVASQSLGFDDASLGTFFPTEISIHSGQSWIHNTIAAFKEKSALRQQQQTYAQIHSSLANKRDTKNSNTANTTRNNSNRAYTSLANRRGTTNRNTAAKTRNNSNHVYTPKTPHNNDGKRSKDKSVSRKQLPLTKGVSKFQNSQASAKLSMSSSESLTNSTHNEKTKNHSTGTLNTTPNNGISAQENIGTDEHFLNMEYVMESGNYDSDEGSQDNQIQYPLTQSNNTWWCDICRLYEYNLVSKSTHNNRNQHRKSSEKNKQQQSVLKRAENPHVLGEQ